jgi:hypothetical protein
VLMRLCLDSTHGVSAIKGTRAGENDLQDDWSAQVEASSRL